MSTEASPSGTPAPPAPVPPAGPSPLQIGKSFIKQYYKTLLEKPSQIQKFYQPDSILSRGMEPSAPTDPLAISEVLNAAADDHDRLANDPGNGSAAFHPHDPSDTPAERIRKTFFEWAGRGIEELASSKTQKGGDDDGAKDAAVADDDDADDDDDDVLRIDFERGAIDAQESVGGGILLVVTGHMFLPSSKPSVASPFVHTFFLNNGAPPGRKRQFYVRNDVLRFLLPVLADEPPVAVGVEEKEKGKEKEKEKEEEKETKVNTGEDEEQEKQKEEEGVPVAVPEDEEEAPKKVDEETVAVEKEAPAVPPADTTVSEIVDASVEAEVEEAVEESKAETPESSVESARLEVEPVTELDAEPPIEVEPQEEEAVEETKEEVVFEPTAEVESPTEEGKAPVEPTASDSAEVATALEGKKKRYRRRRGGGAGGGGKSSRSSSPAVGAGDGDDAAESPIAVATAESKEEQPPPQQPEKPKTPGSWASLVAGGSGPVLKEDGPAAGKTKGHPKQDRRVKSPKGQGEDKAATSASINHHHHDSSTAKAPPQSQQTSRSYDRTHAKDNTHQHHQNNNNNNNDTSDSAAGPSATTTNNVPPPQSRTLSNQRTPEATLFIRNIPDATKEPEIRSLFESYGVANGNRILGITLNANRGFCFVDFDGTAAVYAIVEEAQKSLVKDERTGRKIESSFMVHGRVLDVDQKIKTLQPGGSGSGAGGGMGSGGGGGRRYNRSPPGSRGTRGMGMRRSPPRDGGRRSSGGGGNR